MTVCSAASTTSAAGGGDDDVAVLEGDEGRIPLRLAALVKEEVVQRRHRALGKFVRDDPLVEKFFLKDEKGDGVPAATQLVRGRTSHARLQQDGAVVLLRPLLLGDEPGEILPRIGGNKSGVALRHGVRDEKACAECEQKHKKAQRDAERDA